MINKPFVHSKQHERRTPIHTHILSSFFVIVFSCFFSRISISSFLLLVCGFGSSSFQSFLRRVVCFLLHWVVLLSSSSARVVLLSLPSFFVVAHAIFSLEWVAASTRSLGRCCCSFFLLVVLSSFSSLGWCLLSPSLSCGWCYFSSSSGWCCFAYLLLVRLGN